MRFLFLLLLLPLAGCGTFSSLFQAELPRGFLESEREANHLRGMPYAGVQWDVLEADKAFVIGGLWYVDLPFSFVFDTAFLPFTSIVALVTWANSEPPPDPEDDGLGDPNQIKGTDSRLLHALRAGEYALAEKLLEAGAEPNLGHSSRHFVYTPLWWAARQGDRRAVELLLEYGASPFLGQKRPDGTHQLPVEAADWNDHPGLVKIIDAAMHERRRETEERAPAPAETPGEAPLEEPPGGATVEP